MTNAMFEFTKTFAETKMLRLTRHKCAKTVNRADFEALQQISTTYDSSIGPKVSTTT
jgi:hypothetical protein